MVFRDSKGHLCDDTLRAYKAGVFPVTVQGKCVQECVLVEKNREYTIDCGAPGCYPQNIGEL